MPSYTLQSPTNPAVGTQTFAPAVVTIGRVLPDPIDQTNYITSVQTGTIFTDYQIYNMYEMDRHIYMAGVTSPTGFNGAGAAFFRLANQTVLIVSPWTAMKLGDAKSGAGVPEVPDPTSAPGDWVLLDVQVRAAQIYTLPDGTHGIYRLSGAYFYGITNPSEQVFRYVQFGKPPWLVDGLARTVPVAKILPNLMFQSAAAPPQLLRIAPGPAGPP